MKERTIWLYKLDYWKLRSLNSSWWCWSGGRVMVEWWWKGGRVMVEGWWRDGGVMVEWWWKGGGVMVE